MTPQDYAEAAEAHLAESNFVQALAACDAGAALVKSPFKRAALFRGIADRAALAAAAARGPDADAGFGGRRFVVQPAATAGGGDSVVTLMPGGGSGSRRGVFDSLEDALAAADDADKIVLLPGTHLVRAPGGLAIEKRVLVCAAVITPARHTGGSNGSTAGAPLPAAAAAALAAAQAPSAAVIDYRGNAPLFRVARACALRGFAVDMVGFAPAVLVEGSGGGRGSDPPAPLFDRVSIACSGGDALAVGGNARPLLLDCDLTGRTAGVRAYEAAHVELRGCRVTTSGGGGGGGTSTGGGSSGVMAAAPAGVVVQESASASLDACRVHGCAGEGVAVSGRATAKLVRGTVVGDCGGPAVDASDEAFVALSDAELTGCVGGLWLWGRARAHAERSLFAPARSFAVVLDGGASATSGGDNVVDGPVLAGDEPGGDGGNAPAPDVAAARAELLTAAAAAAVEGRAAPASCGATFMGRPLVAGSGGGQTIAVDHFPPNVPPFIDDGPAFMPL